MPLGKLLLVGLRTRTSSCSSGRWRSTTDLAARFTNSEETPAVPSETHGPAAPRPPAPGLEGGQPHPDEAVVGQVGDQRGGAVDLRLSPPRLEHGIDGVIETRRGLVETRHGRPLMRR